MRFDNFQELDPESADLVRDLLDNAERQRSAFMSFASLWMAFNGWMESVTDGSHDAAMITELSDSRRLNEAFETLAQENDAFRERIETFSSMWPVLNVRDARHKLGRDASSRLSREEFEEQAARLEVKSQPVGWAPGDLPTWGQVLRTIYQIRCNMFHGTKSPRNPRDRQLILQSERILKTFIVESRCFEWGDD